MGHELIKSRPLRVIERLLDFPESGEQNEYKNVGKGAKCRE